LALSRVGVATASATTVTPPAHLAGDLILIFAYRSGSTTAPTLPNGYKSILTKAGTSCSARVGYKIATSTSDASGTWTNATEMVCHVYRASVGTPLPAAFASSASTTNTVNYPAITLADTSGNSWVVGFGGVNNTTETIATAPSGMTNESSITGAAAAAAGHDTNGGVTTWASTNATTTGTAGNSVSCVVEVMLAPLGSQSNLYQAQVGHVLKPSSGLTSNSFNAPYLYPSGPGNCYVVAMTLPNGTTPTIGTDSDGNVWSATPAVHANAGAGNCDTYYFVLGNAKGSAQPNKLTIATSSAIAGIYIELYEFYGISTSSPTNGSSSSAFANGPNLAAGSFTPGNNNANGGNIILLHAAKANNAGGASAPQANIFVPSTFTLLESDISDLATDATPKATAMFVQTTSAAINPSCTAVGDTDQWNTLALALTLSPGAGTTPSAQIQAHPQVRTHLHFSTGGFPTNATYALQVPSSGNLRLLMSDDPNIDGATVTVTDSEGHTWNNTAHAAGFWFLDQTSGAQANSNLIVYISANGGSSQLSWRYMDIVGALATPYDSFVVSNQSVTAPSFVMSPPPVASTLNTSGLCVWNVGLGQGPGTAMTLPTGGVFTLFTYAGETDFDTMENADLGGIFHNITAGTITAQFTITNSTSTSGGAILFRAASAVGWSPPSPPPGRRGPRRTFASRRWAGAPVSTTVTAALTGQRATFSAGTLVPKNTAALAGSAVTSHAGTLGAKHADALTGASITSTAGVFAEKDFEQLTGQRATFTAGTMTATTSSTVALTGQRATFTPGSLLASLKLPLTGVRATYATGQVVPGLSLALLGTRAGLTTGLLAPSSRVPVTGQSATFTSGTVTYNAGGGTVTVALTGAAATFTAGTLAAVNPAPPAPVPSAPSGGVPGYIPERRMGEGLGHERLTGPMPQGPPVPSPFMTSLPPDHQDYPGAPPNLRRTPTVKVTLTSQPDTREEELTAILLMLGLL